MFSGRLDIVKMIILPKVFFCFDAELYPNKIPQDWSVVCVMKEQE